MSDPLVARFLRKAGSALAGYGEGKALGHALGAAGVQAAPKIQTFTSKNELVALYELARRCPQGTTALEIGSYLGASTCYLAAGLAQVGGTLYCVDTWQNQTMPDGVRDTMGEFSANTAGVKDRVKIIRKPSSELTDADVPAKLGFAFIDGDHSYEATRGDFDRVQPWLLPNAIVAMHDHAHYRGVARVLGEILATGNWAVAGVKENLIWITRPTKLW